MSWLYEQVSGRLYQDTDKLVGIGYSGDPQHRNNPAAEHLEGKGPIPFGTYHVIGPPFNSPEHGDFVLRLEPEPITRARIVKMGRDPDSFLLHGDSISKPGTASKGCVIQPKETRVSVWTSGDNVLDVVDRIRVDDGEVS